jgi:hypothetical protein
LPLLGLPGIYLTFLASIGPEWLYIPGLIVLARHIWW